MILWSPFLLDAMAGLSDDARARPARSAATIRRTSPSTAGSIGPLAGADGAPAQYGTISDLGHRADGDIGGAQQLVEYLLSDGYLRWLAISPQGKYPVRAGDASRPRALRRGWAELESGVDRQRAAEPSSTREASIDSLGDGVRNFQRWGFEQDQARAGRRDERPAAGHQGARGGDPRRHHARRGGRAGAGGRRAATGLARITPW